jgi:hypothetical protein
MQETFWQVKEAIDAYFGEGSFAVTVQAACIRGRKPLAGESVSTVTAEPLVEPETDRRIRVPESELPEALTPPSDTGEIPLNTGEIEVIGLDGRSGPQLLDDDDDEETP